MGEGPAWSGQTLSFVLALPILPVRHQTSIFGASELNCRVRDGNGWTLTAINTNLSFNRSLGQNYYEIVPLQSPFVKDKSFGVPTKQSPALWGKEEGTSGCGAFATSGSGTELASSDVVTRTGFEPMLTA